MTAERTTTTSVLPALNSPPPVSFRPTPGLGTSDTLPEVAVAPVVTCLLIPQITKKNSSGECCTLHLNMSLLYG